eukprot:SAG11_NODE_73_length_18072_cov_8.670005_12_plen_304_part_00
MSGQPAPEPESGAEVSNADLLAALQGLSANVAEVKTITDAHGTAIQNLTANFNLSVTAVNALQASVTQLKAGGGAAASPASEEAADPADLLPYVPHFDARDENPHPERPRGVSDKPQLFELNAAASTTYGYLRKRKNAAYHELATLAPVLSYAWDSNFYLKEKLLPHLYSLLDADGSDLSGEVKLGLEALLNSQATQYEILNRRKNLLELRARIESDSPQFTPSDADRKLWEAMAKSIGGWENNLGIDASIDPLFKRLLERYHKDVHESTLKALAKTSAQGQAKPKGRTPKKSPSGAAAGDSG